MHDTIVKMKNGASYCAPIVRFAPEEGWMSLVDCEGGPPIVVKFSEMVSAVTPTERGGSCDEFERARRVMMKELETE